MPPPEPGRLRLAAEKSPFRHHHVSHSSGYCLESACATHPTRATLKPLAACLCTGSCHTLAKLTHERDSQDAQVMNGIPTITWRAKRDPKAHNAFSADLFYELNAIRKKTRIVLQIVSAERRGVRLCWEKSKFQGPKGPSRGTFRALLAERLGCAD